MPLRAEASAVTPTWPFGLGEGHDAGVLSAQPWDEAAQPVVLWDCCFGLAALAAGTPTRHSFPICSSVTSATVFPTQLPEILNHVRFHQIIYILSSNHFEPMHSFYLNSSKTILSARNHKFGLGH